MEGMEVLKRSLMLAWFSAPTARTQLTAVQDQQTHHPPCLEELPGIKKEMFKIAQFPVAGPLGRGLVWAKLSLKLSCHWGIYNICQPVPALSTLQFIDVY